MTVNEEEEEEKEILSPEISKVLMVNVKTLVTRKCLILIYNKLAEE